MSFYLYNVLDLEYLRSVANKPTGKKQKCSRTAPKTGGTKKRKKPGRSKQRLKLELPVRDGPVKK